MSQTKIEDDEEIVIVRGDIPQEEPTPQLPAIAGAQQQQRGPREHQEWTADQASAGEFMDSATLEHMMRIAKIMAAASLIPDSLWSAGTGSNKKALPYQTVVANCFLIVNQARLWKVDAFALAQASSVVHGKVVFEGKAIAAVLESTRGIRLRFTWNDQPGDAFGITVTERDLREGEDERRHVSGTVGAWATKKKGGARSDNWAGPAARQQLAYRGAREWARLHEPGLVLGVFAGDDGEAIDNRIERERAEADDPKPFGSGFRSAPEAKTQAMKARQRARKPKFPQGDDPGAKPEAATTAQDAPGAAEGAAGPSARAEASSPAAGDDAPPMDAFSTFVSVQLPAAQSWADIRLALIALSGSDQWKEQARIDPERGGSGRTKEALRAAWHRTRALMAAAKGSIDVHVAGELLAFRCWLEVQTSSTNIGLMFESVQASDAWAQASEKSRKALTHIVGLRCKECDKAELGET